MCFYGMSKGEIKAKLDWLYEQDGNTVTDWARELLEDELKKDCPNYSHYERD